MLLILQLPLVRRGLHHVLGEGGYTIVGGVATLADAQPFLPDTDLAIVGARLCREEAGAAGWLRARMAGKIVILGYDADLLRLPRDQVTGADGVVSFEVGHEAMFGALRLIQSGERIIPPELAAALAQSAADAATASALSRRECDMLRHLSSGDCNKVIANTLGIAEATVKVHLKGLFRKIRVENRTQAAIWAHNNAEALISSSSVEDVPPRI
ncbi:MAG TPA: response regulator transcription factor [Stellaceae bacterium]|nr:response regulator transcription factor [Stellaceae bacterium]